jgi:hypothetical protein
MRETAMAGLETADRVNAFQPITGYVRSLWRGELSLARVFWTDMILVGSLVNIVSTIAALILFVSGAPIALGVFAHFAPLPYNILLFLAVWQSAARETSDWSFPAQAAALVWLIAAIVI